MNNAFLRDFMKMRSTLHTKQEESRAVPTNRSENLTGVTLATILEKKPGAKVVLEYFKKRAKELEEATN